MDQDIYTQMKNAIEEIENYQDKISQLQESRQINYRAFVTKIEDAMRDLGQLLILCHQANLDEFQERIFAAGQIKLTTNIVQRKVLTLTYMNGFPKFEIILHESGKIVGDFLLKTKNPVRYMIERRWSITDDLQSKLTLDDIDILQNSNISKLLQYFKDLQNMLTDSIAKIEDRIQNQKFELCTTYQSLLEETEMYYRVLKEEPSDHICDGEEQESDERTEI